MAPAGAKTRISRVWGAAIDCLRVENGWKRVRVALKTTDLKWKGKQCPCRPPPAESRNFSGHLKSASPDFCDLGSKLIHFEQNQLYVPLLLQDQWASLSIAQDPERLCDPV